MEMTIMEQQTDRAELPVAYCFICGCTIYAGEGHREVHPEKSYCDNCDTIRYTQS